jgi:hypothetical protein
MESTRILKLASALLFVGLIGCDTDDTQVIDTEQEIFTEPATETVEIERMTEDTFMVERTTEVTVDTTRIEGDDDLPEAEPSQPETRY